MFSITYTPMDVKDYFKPALTSEDFDRLDAAHAYYADAGKGYHTFAQTCSEPTCNGYWCITISETDPMFRGAIDRAVSGGLCRACQDAQRVAMPSLITYRAKSGSANGGAGGGSKGKPRTSHRPRKSRKGYTDADIKRMEAELAELCDWLDDVATGEVEATASMIKAAVSRRDGLAATIQTYRTWKAIEVAA